MGEVRFKKKLCSLFFMESTTYIFRQLLFMVSRLLVSTIPILNFKMQMIIKNLKIHGTPKINIGIQTMS